MNRIYYLILFLSVVELASATDLREAIAIARKHAGAKEYSSYKVNMKSLGESEIKSMLGDAWVLLDTLGFIEKQTRLKEVVPTMLLNTFLIQIEACPSNCYDQYVFVTDDSVRSYNRNRKLKGYPPPLDIAYPISVMNDMLESESGRQHTVQELMRFVATIFEIELTIKLILNSWIDVYIEFHGGLPYQYLSFDIDKITPEIAEEVEADWLTLEQFKNKMPMEVRSEITAPESDIINDQVVLTYYLLSLEYDIIKYDIIIRDNRFELSAVDSLGNYIADE